jgi:acyl-CoA reductase-like NAD-dependent aldehyde dehydrogenase
MLAELTARNELSKLKDARLFREHAYLGGKWTAAKDGKVMAVTNPATGEQLGVVPALGAAETEAAIAAAAAAFPAWRQLLPQQRAAHLRRWYELMIEAKDDLALIMTLEQGKPLAEAEGEIAYAASFIEWYAEEARRVNVEGITPHLPNRQMSVRREPIGVVAAVTPWNFPSAMITRKAAAALAAGCPILVRPAS